MTVVDPTSMIAALSTMPEEDFRAVVQRDLLHDATEEEMAALRSPALVDRWLMTLVQTSKSVEGQLSARREDYEATKSRLKRELSDATAVLAKLGPADQADQAEKCRQLEMRLLEARERYAKSRSGTLRFKTGLDEWIIEARSLRDQLRDRLYDTVVAEERNRLAERTRVLEDGIRTHRENFPDDDDPSDGDEALWQLVD